MLSHKDYQYITENVNDAVAVVALATAIRFAKCRPFDNLASQNYLISQINKANPQTAKAIADLFSEIASCPMRPMPDTILEFWRQYFRLIAFFHYLREANLV